MKAIALHGGVIAAGVAITLGVLFSGALSSYAIFILTMIFMYSCLATSLDIMVGLTGRVMFCITAFFGVGAYTSALVMIYWHWSFLVATLFAALVTTALALPIAAVTLRLNGMYFALATTALGISFTTVIQLQSLAPVTGGATGLVGIPAESYLKSPTSFLIMFLILLTVVLITRVVIAHSPFGERLRALRDDEQLARTLGIRTNSYKVSAFVITAVIAGITGSCFAIFFGTIAPSEFDIWTSFNVIVWVLVGGAGTVYGPLLGVALLWTVPQLLGLDPNVNELLYGLLLIIVIMFRRGGIAGAIKDGYSFVSQRLRPPVDGTRSGVAHEPPVSASAAPPLTPAEN